MLDKNGGSQSNTIKARKRGARFPGSKKSAQISLRSSHRDRLIL